MHIKLTNSVSGNVTYLNPYFVTSMQLVEGNLVYIRAEAKVYTKRFKTAREAESFIEHWASLISKSVASHPYR